LSLLINILEEQNLQIKLLASVF